jgi:small subunit ribosomal protein S20
MGFALRWRGLSSNWPTRVDETSVLYSAADRPPAVDIPLPAHRGLPFVARKARTWKGARTPSARKRARQALRRRAVNRRTRSETRTLVQQAASVASGRTEGDATEAVAAAISALDKAAEKGIIHPNNAARRKSRLMAKVNAAHALDSAASSGPRRRTTAGKTEQRKKVAAAKASKAAAARSADRPRTAAGKARVAVTRATRETSAAQRRSKKATTDEAPTGDGAES